MTFPQKKLQLHEMQKWKVNAAYTALTLKISIRVENAYQILILPVIHLYRWTILYDMKVDVGSIVDRVRVDDDFHFACF